MSYKSVTIANYFIENFRSNDLTPMKLIKLTYLAYCWYLALSNKDRLINEKAQAWDFGPVFPSLYRELKSYGRRTINSKINVANEE